VVAVGPEQGQNVGPARCTSTTLILSRFRADPYNPPPLVHGGFGGLCGDDLAESARRWHMPSSIPVFRAVPTAADPRFERMADVYQPVIIIGAARSGTNMLRDVLTSLPGAGTWPCDEINYIWRHRNARNPLDEFQSHQATGPVRRFIRGEFDRIAGRGGLDVVVEKTCANSLRVGFVDRVVPDARYLFLGRDGVDVVASAMTCWTNPIDLGYIFRKARFVPWRDVPYYGARYLANRLYHLVSGKKRLAAWGPRFEGMQRALVERSLAEVCALQWARSVQLASEALAGIDADRVLCLQYEQFVDAPQKYTQRIVDFLEIDVDPTAIASSVAGVSRRSVGKGRRQLDDETIASIMPILESVPRQPEVEAPNPSQEVAA